MIEDYLSSRILPHTVKPIVKRSLKWTRPCVCCDRSPVDAKAKAMAKAQFASKIVESELQQFNDFTIDDNASPEEQDYQKQVNSGSSNAEAVKSNSNSSKK